MQLEKILEEIDVKIAGSMGRKREGLLEAEGIIRKHMNDGWILVEKFGLPKINEHDFRFWVTIQYVNGFRHTIKAKWIVLTNALCTQMERKYYKMLLLINIILHQSHTARKGAKENDSK